MKLAVQLYSLRDHIQTGEDLLALFPKIKAIGFDGVEFAGYFGLPAAKIRCALDEAGLVAIGTHIGIENYMPYNLKETLEYARVLGMPYSGTGGAPHHTPDEIRVTCAVFAYASKLAAEQGVTIYYHNHVDEFTPYADGTVAMDALFDACSVELDTYWSFCAGIDNEAYITAHKDKIRLIHIKDGIGHNPLALGEGECDLAAVVRGAKTAGIEWLVLENDNPKPYGLNDIARSMEWLKRNV
ncbi:MAG: sugar phosphate isomerase/epimerase [Oscillospiraceae bacterium]|jgi:sugar phosphate isomerase/epimerase|nr:sugar phosphate isomerase/epimerase [Oscillospiraceae bacterium]